MGQSKLSKEKVETLVKETNRRLSKDDIARLFGIFIKFAPTGKMVKEQLTKMQSSYSDGYSPDVDTLFRIMDTNKDGFIDFKEYLVYVSMTNPSYGQATPEDILLIAFAIYDSDGDGFLTEQEIRDATAKVLRAKGYDVEKPSIANMIDNKVQLLMQVVDADVDKKLSREECLEALAKDPNLLTFF